MPISYQSLLNGNPDSAAPFLIRRVCPLFSGTSDHLSGPPPAFWEGFYWHPFERVHSISGVPISHGGGRGGGEGRGREAFFFASKTLFGAYVGLPSPDESKPEALQVLRAGRVHPWPCVLLRPRHGPAPEPAGLLEDTALCRALAVRWLRGVSFFILLVPCLKGNPFWIPSPRLTWKLRGPFWKT